MKTNFRATSFLFIISVIFSITANAQINLNNGLVGHFSFDNNAFDQSSVGVSGTVYNAILTAGKTNNPNEAYSFNGVNSYIDCSSNQRSISSTVTVSAWVKTTTMGLQFIVSKYDWTVDKGFHLFIQNGTAQVAGRNNGGLYVTTNNSSSANILVADGNWHFVMAEVSGNSWKVWVDCVLNNSVISNSSVPSLINTGPLSIGNYIQGTTAGNQLFFNGAIDEVRVYNRTLTIDERALLCDINFSGSISAPIVSQDTGVCENESVTLQASSNSGTIYWESPLGVIIDSGNVHSQVITQPTVFYVYSVQNGMSSSNSIITVNMANLVDTSITSNGFSLFSNATNVMYQWIDCENWTLIQGEVGQVFTPSASGYYALAVTNEYCSDTSDCIQVIPLGVNELTDSDVQIYPNPTTNIVVVEAFSTSRIYGIQVLDVSGEIIFQRKENFNSKAVVDLSSYRTGMYFIRVSFKETTKVFKIVKE